LVVVAVDKELEQLSARRAVHSPTPAAIAVARESLGVGSREPTLRRLLAFADLLAIVSALAFALAFASGGRASLGDFAWGLLTLPGWIVLFNLYGLYDRDAKRVSHSTVDDVPWIFHALVVGSLLLWFYFRAVAEHQLILRQGIAFFVLAGVGIFFTRASVRSLAAKGLPPDRVLFLGGGPMAQLLIQKIEGHPEYGLDAVGFVDGIGVQPGDLQIPRLGSIDELGDVCRREAIDRLLVAAPESDEAVLTELLRSTKKIDVRISILPHMVDVLGPSVEIDDVEGITVLGLNPPALTRSSRFLKRAMDVLVSSAALVLLSPLLAAIAAAIKLTSRGPVLFTQERVGHGGRHFRMHKFRTMVADAEERANELLARSSHPAWLLLDHDPRITPLGRVLRRTSLDELPQLWDVLRGSMSLVGPRPMPVEVDEKIAGWGRRRLDLTPGVTGLWQVLGRTDIPFEEMVKLDYLYVTNWSLWHDVRLLIRTLPAVFRRRGVN
jgi:exopolysaccharide biosynthesis polyprenyl glycosylphosphotransferase